MSEIKKKKFKHLNMSKREVIDNMLKKGYTKKEIAAAVGCSIRTIYYELKRSSYEHTISKRKKELRYAPKTAEEKIPREFKSERSKI